MLYQNGCLTFHSLGVISVALDQNGCLRDNQTQDASFHPNATGGLPVIALSEPRYIIRDELCAGEDREHSENLKVGQRNR